MIRIKPSNNDIIKNYFLEEGMIGKIFKAEVKELSEVSPKLIYYLAQFEVGPYTMHQRFTPGKYLFFWVEFSDYVRQLFIMSANGEQKGLQPFFNFSTVQLTFEDPCDFVVW